MSLINDALKKAQRSRHGDPAELSAPPMPGGATQISKRRPPRSAKTLFVLGSGALVLIVLSVVVTVYLISRPARPKSVAAASPSPATAPAPAKMGAASPEVSPVIVPPVIKPAAPAATSRPPVAVAPVTAPENAPAAPPETAPPPLPAISATSLPPPIEAMPPAATKAAITAQPDARVHAFVDSIRVSGVLPRGAESRVLINDRVYRLNDIVDRTLSVRLTKVEAGSLTFSDANGVHYVKVF